jgi:hypothetical protein
MAHHNETMPPARDNASDVHTLVFIMTRSGAVK